MGGSGRQRSGAIGRLAEVSLIGVNPKALTSRGNVDVTCAETWGDRL
jgi:hypothetical protein